MVTSKRKPLEPSGSPITVDGGGSVRIRFDHGAYNHRRGSNKHVTKNTATVISLLKVTGHEDIPLIGDETIEIYLR